MLQRGNKQDCVTTRMYSYEIGNTRSRAKHRPTNHLDQMEHGAGRHTSYTNVGSHLLCAGNINYLKVGGLL